MYTIQAQRSTSYGRGCEVYSTRDAEYFFDITPFKGEDKFYFAGIVEYDNTYEIIAVPIDFWDCKVCCNAVVDDENVIVELKSNDQSSLASNTFTLILDKNGNVEKQYDQYRYNGVSLTYSREPVLLKADTLTIPVHTVERFTPDPMGTCQTQTRFVTSKTKDVHKSFAFKLAEHLVDKIFQRPTKKQRRE